MFFLFFFYNLYSNLSTLRYYSISRHLNRVLDLHLNCLQRLLTTTFPSLIPTLDPKTEPVVYLPSEYLTLPLHIPSSPKQSPLFQKNCPHRPRPI